MLHGNLCIAEQGFLRLTVIRKDTNPDAGSEEDFLCADDERLRALFPRIVKRYYTYGLRERISGRPEPPWWRSAGHAGCAIGWTN